MVPSRGRTNQIQFGTSLNNILTPTNHSNQDLSIENKQINIKENLNFTTFFRCKLHYKVVIFTTSYEVQVVNFTTKSVKPVLLLTQPL